MNFTYENQGANTYLVYRIGPDDQIDTMSLGMLTNNVIPGLAPVLFTQMDTEKYLKYNVTAQIPVSQFFAGIVNRRRLIGVFCGIADAMLSAEDYMLEPGTILLDPEYIFTDVSTCETTLLCLPIIRDGGEALDVKEFFRKVMLFDNTQFDQTENCDYVAKIINYLNMSGRFVLSDFKEMLKGLETTGGKAAAVSQRKEPQPRVPAGDEKEPVKKQKQQLYTKQPDVYSQPDGYQYASVPQPQPVQTPKPQTFPQPQPAQAQTVPQGEKEISWLYLMQHYNKENAAAYKAQKEAKKSGKQGKQTKQTKQQDNTVSQIQTGGGFGFDIPNQSPVNAGGMGSTPVAEPIQKPIEQPRVPTPQPQGSEAAGSQPVNPVFNRIQTQQANFGETTQFNVSTNPLTTVLNQATMEKSASPHLFRAKNNERIRIDKPVFRIGKEKSYVDYFIGDNTAVSRSHANIIVREGEYFVMDTNSTNHTFLNGMMVNSNQEVKLSHGDKLRFANEEFEFRVY